MKICVKLICLQIFIATILMRRKLSQVIKDEISPFTNTMLLRYALQK